MTYVYNDPAEFKEDALKGFAAAYPQYVSRVEGASGFTRAGGPLEGKVSLVIGGGSGHYPAFCGTVGRPLRVAVCRAGLPDRQGGPWWRRSRARLRQLCR